MASLPNRVSLLLSFLVDIIYHLDTMIVEQILPTIAYFGVQNNTSKIDW